MKRPARPAFWISVASLALAAFLFQGCNTAADEEGAGSLDGVWMMASLISTYEYDGESYADTMSVDTADIYGRTFYAIYGKTIFGAQYSAYTDVGLGASSMVSRIVPLSGNKWLVGTDTTTVIRKGDHLTLISSYEDDEYGESGTDEVHLVAYKGTFPPDEWFVSPEEVYEPDNTYQTAKPIPVTGISQYRYLTEGDKDWFSFKAVKGQSYHISGTASDYANYGLKAQTLYDFQIRLYGKDGTALLDFSDEYIDWECPSSGTYYVRANGSSTDEGGYGLWIYEYDPADETLRAAAKAGKAQSRNVLRGVEVRKYGPR